MRIKLIKVEDTKDGCFLPIPDSVLMELNLSVGDEVTLDISVTAPDTMIIYKSINPTQKVGDEPV